MLLKRPIITIFIVYSLFLVISDVCGLFLPTNQSFLYYLSSYYRNVEVEGRVISLVQSYGWGSTFVMETKRAGGAKVVEKVLVSLPRAYKVDYGDNIVLWGRLSIPQKAPFPLVFDYQNFLARDEIYVLMRADSCEFISSAPNLIMKFAFYVREDIVNKIDKYLKKGTADLLKPLIIGDKSGLDNPTKTLFMDAGLTHILVVSGLNVGFVAALFIAIFKFAGIPLRKRFIVVIPLIFLYVLATGANPPVLRAGIMTTCFLISLSVQREPLIYNSLALSALIILIFTPQQLFTASFQMSYAATIAIVYFYKKFYVPFSKVRNRFLKILIGAFCATTAAQVTMIPISAYYFGQFSLVSFISNTVIVPLVGFITTLGFVFYILTFISKFLAAGAAFILEILLDAVLAAVSFFGQTKYAALIVPKPHIWQAVLFFAGSFAAPFLKGAKRIIVLAIILGIFVTFFMTIGGSKNGEYFYENRNMSVLHIKSDKKDLFIVRKKLKYDKNYVKSLGEYIRFKGIKNPDLITEGFDERLLREDLGILKGQRAGFSQID